MAERLVIYLFKQNPEKIQDFARSIEALQSSLSYCQQCFNISEDKLCAICSDKSRDQKTICVVEEPLDIFAIEKTKKFNGLYHVLGGVLEPVANNNKLRISELEDRVKNNSVSEIILAMNPTTEGDATALYVARTLKDSGATITRLARGLSTGGDIEYADELTLGSAILNRK